MTDPLILAAPLLLLLVIAVLFLFVGCSKFDEEITPPGGKDYVTVVTGTSGFLGLWRLDEASGNQAKVTGPLSPMLDGTYKLEGVTLKQTGIVPSNSAVVLNGSSGFVEVPYDVRVNSANNVSFSIEFWVKPNPSAGGPAQVVISSHFTGPGGKQSGYEIALLRAVGSTETKFRARLFRPSSTTPTEVIASPNVGAPDEWRHVVMAFDGAATPKKLVLYVGVKGNASLFIEQASPAPYEAVEKDKSTLRFGAGHGAAAAAVDFFAGTLDEVAFYNVALPKGDVEGHFGMLNTT